MRWIIWGTVIAVIVAAFVSVAIFYMSPELASQEISLQTSDLVPHRDESQSRKEIAQVARSKPDEENESEWKLETLSFMKFTVPVSWQAVSYDSDSSSSHVYAPNPDKPYEGAFIEVSTTRIDPGRWCSVQGCPPEDPDEYVKRERQRWDEVTQSLLQQNSCVKQGEISFDDVTDVKQADYHFCKKNTVWITIDTKWQLYQIHLVPDTRDIDQSEVIPIFIKNARLK